MNIRAAPSIISMTSYILSKPIPKINVFWRWYFKPTSGKINTKSLLCRNLNNADVSQTGALFLGFNLPTKNLNVYSTSGRIREHSLATLNIIQIFLSHSAPQSSSSQGKRESTLKNAHHLIDLILLKAEYLRCRSFWSH